MSDYNATYAAYLGLMNAEHHGERDREIDSHRAAVLNDMLYSPDYHDDCKRNGVKQGLMLTRGGEANTYNVICRPGDQLYAGDIIDAFGEKWIVMEARADDTTHKTGIMHQCNHFMRWQNFDAKIHSTWCYLRASGYSAYINSDAQLQKSDEQEVIYLPLNEHTEKIYVDKRLPLQIAYDEHGEKILQALKVTGVNAVTRSFNDKDHLLMLKVEADVEHTAGGRPDNLELMICNYIEGGIKDDDDQSGCDCDDCPWKEDDSGPDPTPVKRTISIDGKATIRAGKSSVYTAVVSDDAIVEWQVTEVNGISYEIDGNTLKIKTAKSTNIGDTVEITASYGEASARIEVEVIFVV